jgi:putative tricarboxylic transport membrane protein
VKKYERITGAVTAVGGAAVMYYAWRELGLGSIHAPDAGLVPFLCGAGLAVLGIIWAVMLQWTEEKRGDASAEKKLWHKPLLSLLLMVAYAWAMETVGYISSTLLFMVAWEQIIERERWVKTIVIALLGTLSMYALFVFVLHVPVPAELFLR